MTKPIQVPGSEHITVTCANCGKPARLSDAFDYPDDRGRVSYLCWTCAAKVGDK